MKSYTAALCALAAIVLAATDAAPALAIPVPAAVTLAAHGVEASADAIP